MYRRERDAVRRGRPAQLFDTQAAPKQGKTASDASSAPGGGLRRRGGGSQPLHSAHRTPAGGSVPLGARLCDALLFGSTAGSAAEPQQHARQLEDLVAHDSGSGSGSDSDLEDFVAHGSSSRRSRIAQEIASMSIAGIAID